MIYHKLINDSLKSAVVTLSLLVMCIVLTTPAVAASKGSKGGGPVIQEQVNTGIPTLDKEINKFYTCILKTHHDPPTIEKVDSCYYQAIDGAGSISSGDCGSGSVSTSKYGVRGAGTSPTYPPISTS
jgi:hypothetical protein